MRDRKFKVLGRINPKTAFLLLASLLLMLVPAPAWAHKVNVFAYVEGAEVIAEGYFADGGKCRNSVVEVYDDKGKKLLEGKTDAEGRFVFKPPAHTDLLVRLIASMGHQAEYILPATDLPPGGQASSQFREQREEKPEDVQPAQPEAVASGEASTVTPTTDVVALEQAIDRAVARQVAPLRRALEEERNRRSFLDVVGGIGYIIGLMGVILYFRSKRSNS